MHNQRLTQAIYQDEGNIPEQYSLVSVVPHHLGTTYRVFDKLNARYSRIVSFNISLLSEERISYYTNEFQKIKQISHPNLIPIMGVDRHGDRLMFTMGEFNCATFSSFIEDSRISFEETLEVAVQIAGVLEELHSYKVYHGALEPEYIFIDPTFKITVSPPLLDSLQIELHKENYKLRSGGKIQKEDSNTSGNRSSRNVDIASLGSLICFASTGYLPKQLPGTDWEIYGLASELHEIVHRSIASNECRDSRFFRKNALARWSPLVKSNEKLDKLKNNMMDKPVTVLMDGKYELQNTISSDALTTTFNTLDHSNDKKKLLLHVFQHSADATWQNDFKALSRKLTKLDHQNISNIRDAKLIEKMGYITRDVEFGETLVSFMARHTFNFKDIVNFARQVISGIAACENIGVQHYRLSRSTVVVYKTADDQYLYRLTGVERSALESIKPDDGVTISSITYAEMLAPEMYKDTLKEFKTIQYQIAQLIILLATGNHPCSGFTMEEAESYHTSRSDTGLGDAPFEIPSKFMNLIARMTSTLMERRFASPVALYHALSEFINETEAETVNS